MSHGLILERVSHSRVLTVVPVVFHSLFGTALSAAGGEEGEGFFRAMDVRKLLQTTPPTQAVGYLVCGLGNRTSPQHRTFQAKRLCLLEGQVCSHHHLDNGKLLKALLRGWVLPWH